MKRLYLLGLLCVLFITGQAQKQDSIRVLFIGNSYTYYNDLPEMLRELGKTQNMNFAIGRVLKGGERFSGHLKNPKLRSVLQRKWDYIILQEQSTLPASPTAQVLRDCYPYAHALDSLIHVDSPQAKVIFYMTWGHKYGTVHDKKGTYPLRDSYDGMQERLKTSYLEMTYDNNAWCAPVGMAWKKVRELHPEYSLYVQDTYHPSPVGSYLAANVIFTTICQKHYQSDYAANLDVNMVEILQQIAQNTVLDNLELLNIR